MGRLNTLYYRGHSCGSQIVRGRAFLRVRGASYGRFVSTAVMALLLAGVIAGIHFPTGLYAAASGGPASVAVKENPKDGLNYVWIPAGTFMMGCSPGDQECKEDEKPAHRVTISAGFWMGQIAVPGRAYRKYASENGLRLEFSELELNLPIGTWDSSWYSASGYCGWASGRLPTEAEWEYAARGGSTESRYGNLKEIAWYVRNSNRMAHEGALKKPNAFGLYDMLGNVWEWVNDWYDPKYYQSGAAQAPPGPASGQEKVLRGGSWIVDPNLLRVSNRYSIKPDARSDYFGFRCVWEPKSP